MIDKGTLDEGLSRLRLDITKDRIEAFRHRDGTIRELKSQLEKQELTLQALTRFLVERQGLDQGELEEFIQRAAEEAAEAPAPAAATPDPTRKPIFGEEADARKSSGS